MKGAATISTEFGEFTTASKERLDILFRREIPQLRLLVETIGVAGADLFLDIGANIGAYSAIVAHRTDVVEIHAFEPSPAAYSEMMENFRVQGRHVNCHKLALSSSEGETEFIVMAPMSGSNAISRTSAIKRRNEQVMVKTACLDSVLGCVGRVAAVKIDVEGHELEALRGARAFLRNNECILQIELLDVKADEEAIAFLKELGYEKALFIYNDHYFIREDNSVLRESMRDFGFEAYRDFMTQFLELDRYSGTVTSQIRRFVREFPEHADKFPPARKLSRRVFPSKIHECDP